MSTRQIALDDSVAWRVLETLPVSAQVIDAGFPAVPRGMRAVGRGGRLAAAADSALPFLERSAAGASRDWWFRGQLALAQAIAGRTVATRTAPDRARAVADAAPDAIDAKDLALHAAKVAILLGASDAPIAHLREALAPPTRSYAAFVRADLRYAPLRGDPRFQQLVNRQ